MSRSRTTTDLRAEVRQRADMVNSAFVTDWEVDRAVSQSWTQLYEQMCSSGEDYYLKYVDIAATNGGFYDFAPLNTSVPGLKATDVYQVRGVDAVYSDEVVVNVPRFNWEERNIYAATPALNPYYPIIAYRVMQNPVTQRDAIQIIPENSNGISYLRVWYYPSAKAVGYTATVTNGGSGLTNGTYYEVPVHGGAGVGMTATVVIAGGAITSVVITDYTSGYTVPSWAFGFNPNSVYPTFPPGYQTSVGTITVDSLDGRNGWEEWVVIDAAIKLLAKEESDTSQLEREAARVWSRVTTALQNRDAGQAKRITDVSYNTGLWPYSASYARRY